MIASVSGLTVQIIINCFLFLYLGLGLLGCGLSVSLSSILQSIFILAALFRYEEIQPALFWPKFDRDQWSYVKRFLAIGIPSLFVSCLQIAGVEMI
jgi:Na+-driven multidrug efflux pump